MERPDNGSLVVGTAGHVDHGKSALIEALTGVHPDRLEEERRRGLTIELGFASLPSEKHGRISFVDVPGHERFVATMIAGASGIDVGLLVVAVDEGVMPQTREHVAVMSLLGVKHAVVALTKIDLDETDLLPLVRLEVEELLQAHGIDVQDVIPVSAVQRSGLDDLRMAFERMPKKPFDGGGIPHLPIDRVFTLKGFGTVVTGTLAGAGFSAGDEVEIVPSGLRTRIRNIQVHGETRSHVMGGTRAALNLSRVEKRAIRAGDLVALPGTLRSTHRLEARVTVLPDSPVSLGQNARVTVHAGAAHKSGLLFPLETKEIEPGMSGWAQIRLMERVGITRGQRLVLRMMSQPLTIGGAIVADVSPRRRARGTDGERLNRVLSEDLCVALGALLDSRALDLPTLAALAGIEVNTAATAVGDLTTCGTVTRFGSRFATLKVRLALQERLLHVVSDYHRRFPLRVGPPREEIRRALRLPRDSVDDLTLDLVGGGKLAEVSDRGKARDAVPTDVYALPAHMRDLSHLMEKQSDGAKAAERFVDALDRYGLSPPAISKLAVEEGVDDEFVRHLIQIGKLVRVSPELCLTYAQYRRGTQMVIRLIEARGPASVAEIRDELGTSRKFALPLLEHMDAVHMTRRVGDKRTRGDRVDTDRL